MENIQLEVASRTSLCSITSERSNRCGHIGDKLGLKAMVEFGKPIFSAEVLF